MRKIYVPSLCYGCINMILFYIIILHAGKAGSAQGLIAAGGMAGIMRCFDRKTLKEDLPLLEPSLLEDDMAPGEMKQPVRKRGGKH